MTLQMQYAVLKPKKTHLFYLLPLPIVATAVDTTVVKSRRGGGVGERNLLRGWGKCAEHGDGVSKLVGENKTFPLFRFQLV